MGTVLRVVHFTRECVQEVPHSQNFISIKSQSVTQVRESMLGLFPALHEPNRSRGPTPETAPSAQVVQWRQLGLSDRGLQAERELRAEQEKHLSKIEKEKNAAIEKNAAFVVNEATRAPFGIGAPNWLALPTGFVGLAIADLIQPWSTFLPLQAEVPYELPHPLGFD